MRYNTHFSRLVKEIAPKYAKKDEKRLIFNLSALAEIIIFI
jgi:hypothetical protein